MGRGATRAALGALFLVAALMPSVLSPLVAIAYPDVFGWKTGANSRTSVGTLCESLNWQWRAGDELGYWRLNTDWGDQPQTLELFRLYGSRDRAYDASGTVLGEWFIPGSEPMDEWVAWDGPTAQIQNSDAYKYLRFRVWDCSTGNGSGGPYNSGWYLNPRYRPAVVTVDLTDEERSLLASEVAAAAYSRFEPLIMSGSQGVSLSIPATLGVTGTVDASIDRLGAFDSSALNALGGLSALCLGVLLYRAVGRSKL